MAENARIFSVVSVVLAVAGLGCATIRTDSKFDADLDLSGRRTFAIERAVAPPTGMTGDMAVESFGLQNEFEHERVGKVDIIVKDPASGRWLWHGWATETVTERLDANEEIREAVPKILSRFPRAS